MNQPSPALPVAAPFASGFRLLRNPAAQASAVFAPEESARQIFAEHRDEPLWLEAFAAELARCNRRRNPRERVAAVWGLSAEESAALFDADEARKLAGASLTESAARMLGDVLHDESGAPRKFRLLTPAAYYLNAATDVLVHALKLECIPEAVRQALPAHGGVSLLQLARENPARALAACREMFRFE